MMAEISARRAMEDGEAADDDVVEDPAAAECVKGAPVSWCSHQRRHSHGKPFGYTAEGCRGPACTAAVAAHDGHVAEHVAREHLDVTAPPLPDLGPVDDVDPDVATTGVLVDVSTPSKLAQAQLRALIGRGFPVGFVARHMNESRAAIAALADDDDWNGGAHLVTKIGNAFDDYADKTPHGRDREEALAIAVTKARHSAMGWPTVADVRASL